ncbi:ABC transporter substrate-binding protein [Amylibacter marinus]|uniref:ABC transporter substrate-binding protein n=1 Tax=Amylibacter marinus TaxID=1475483 RepID=A0ABQ5VUL0_9RHOB|nr:ABC transporter permease [Amylibacter marinus]GLQ34960.1 ABC transporter substrate-binding protein [Amylibacter marinus]
MTGAKPFSQFERMIAWRYLRSKRAEGGVSVMTWISLIGIALAVFALIATLAVRSGFRTEFVGTILGANAHATLYTGPRTDADGVMRTGFGDFEQALAELRETPGVSRVAGIVKGQVLASANGRNLGVQVFGETLADLKTLPLISEPEQSWGALDDIGNGVAIGSGVARELSLRVGDAITLTSPDGVQTAFGTAPRVIAYDVAYVFQVGRYDIDSTRVYMPRGEAQSYFNQEGRIDEFEIMVDTPELVNDLAPMLLASAPDRALIWTWFDANGGFLRALQMEDNIMFVILGVLVLIATMNIVSGLIMLVKNKGRDIGILRTMGLTEASVLRVFFMCGSAIGVLGTIIGVTMGCLFVIYIDPIFGLINYIAGGGVWDPSVRMLSDLPAELRWQDVTKAVSLSLGLSFGITYFPARRAARMNPVEALRYE